MQSGFARCRINDSVYRMQASRNWTAPRARRVSLERQEECRNLLFDANSSRHPARLLFPLTYKDATAITHLRYYATLLSQFFPTSWNVFFV